MTHRDGTEEPGGADEIAAARDALDGRHDPLDGRGDALRHQSEVDSLRLQNAMDREGKARDAMANTIKSHGETQDQIADNLQ
ncbi:hypothetical protein [Microbacterium pumilum]|uniref:DUF305 domain-containing protein n=1 Tax=Microbacterium pumilum TaxID=344165 RepID=A0ABN2T1Q0_9MICO